MMLKYTILLLRFILMLSLSLSLCHIHKMLALFFGLFGYVLESKRTLIFLLLVCLFLFMHLLLLLRLQLPWSSFIYLTAFTLETSREMCVSVCTVLLSLGINSLFLQRDISTFFSGYCFRALYCSRQPCAHQLNKCSTQANIEKMREIAGFLRLSNYYLDSHSFFTMG